VQALPCLAFSAGLEMAGSSRSECAICLAEFARGEAVRVLPRCNHGFHARCIDRWLAARPTCPTCRQAPFAEPTAFL
jgi:E3 ubiquitin-protein ligase ATL10/75/76/77/78